MEKEPDLNSRLQRELEAVGKNIVKTNVLIAGGTGVGKSSLINHIFGKEIAAAGAGRPITQYMDVYENEKIDVRIYDTKGYEVKDSTVDAFFQSINALVQRSDDPRNAIHLVWYCISCSNGRVQDYDLSAINLFQRLNLPVIIILTKADTPTDYEVKELKKVLPIGIDVFETSIKSESCDQTKQLIEKTADFLPEEPRYSFLKSQTASLQAKWKESHRMIKQHCATAFAIGFIPIPMGDAPLLIANEMTLLARILHLYNLGDMRYCLESGGISTAMGSMLSTGGKAIASNLLKLIPGIGTILGGLITGGVASTIVAAFGEATSKVAYMIRKNQLNKMDSSLLIQQMGSKIMDLSNQYVKEDRKVDDYNFEEV